MNKETAFCALLFNDLADVYFELYEKKGARTVYSLSVWSFDEEQLIVISSSPEFASMGTLINTDEWLHGDFYDGLPHHTKLSIKPHIISCQINIDTHAKHLKKDLMRSIADSHLVEMKYVDCWTAYRDSIYVMLYRDTSVNETPELIQLASEHILVIWREYFYNAINNTLPPQIYINNTIEMLLSNQFRDSRLVECFQIITHISSQYYESARSIGIIAFTRNSDEAIIPIEDLPFTLDYSKLLRKLLETTRYNYCLLVSNFKLYGIGNPSTTILKYKITGHLTWDLIDETDNQVLRYKQGRYYLPLSTEIEELHKLDRKDKFSNDMKKTLNVIVNNLHLAEHGALIIISNEAKREAERLCRKSMGLLAKNPISILEASVLKALTSVDGAVFLDENGQCYAFGVILDGKAGVQGNPARGSRYNSAKTYVANCAVECLQVYAIVRSEDGDTDIFSSYIDAFRPIEEEKRWI